MTPGSAAYLAHVALECAIKALILYRAGCANIGDLKRKSPKIYDQLFRTKHGHDLVRLAQEVRLSKFVGTYGKAWADDTCWKRMTGNDRPYGLRYGSERIGTDAAKEDVSRARDLSGVLLAGIGRGNRKGKKHSGP